MTEPIRWGILGPGKIAHKFARSVQPLEDAKLAAVGSRSQERADAFGEAFDIPNRHGSYEALVGDPAVDIVYVAVPHSRHRDATLLALEAGKAVLCEKPLAINAAQAREMITCAREQKRFLMEGMWTRFFPTMIRLRQLVADGTIGEPRMVTADFGFRAGVDPESRLFNPALGGGALLDVGIYPVSFAFMVLGNPTRVASLATLGETGVDEQAGILFGYEGGELAVLHTAIRTQTAIEATVLGTEGRIRVHHPMFKPSAITVSRKGQDEQEERPYEPEGFQFEAQEAASCLRTDKRESEIMPLDESLAIMETLDELRGQWGLKYPME